ncbi:hypothetical protein ABFS82_09G009400 [Erythranthe guttata]|uniref:receptor-like protein kinase FERONIA isoform X1 n=1 Tax=Erythranthe guttata TaxID=4155 RepID=UPI00064DC071|nr:PREDICTED: receptor-like protein kinase FERONIA isoform X1 [Erythranthe guttata]|eukprot:XP_012855564.1 PREDICTED: receptor-like protein kinase FERONIA isoform X1 [Erythranthe guttata]
MNLQILFLFMFFLSTNNPTYSTGDVSVSCGSSATSAAQDGREWHGDSHPKLHSTLKITGSSTASTVVRKLISADDDDPVPYKTGRLSLSRFSYAFQVNPGQKIIRLHFNPALYKGFERFMDLFDVEAGPFTLLSNFSASLTANVLSVNSFVKEFYVNIQKSQQFDVVFSPAIRRSESIQTYAFVNGVEIVSVPLSLSFFQERDTGVQVVGKSLVYVDNRTALELIRRVNTKQDNRDMFGMWETVTKRKANKIYNTTWRISVDVGFRYLVRLHFSELGFKLAEIGGVDFTVLINEMIADTNIDMVGENDSKNSIAWYRDYVVMMDVHNEEGKRDLVICLRSSDEFIDGFEIMKLSNPYNSFASPNPLPCSRDSSYRTRQNLHRVISRGNMIATAAITLIVAVNIIVYTLRLIWDGSGTEEENNPSARAKRTCRRFSLAEIRLATRNFSDGLVIGRGGFGKVYKGLIDNSQVTVAVKRQKSNSKQGAHEFLTEIETLTELRHVNLVALIGYCNEHGEMILVYEYMAYGTLGDHLYKLARKGHDCPSLTWKQRLAICIGAGRGLDYLHTGHSLVHRDVKASNILLDESFVAKVSDFGLAKNLSRSESLQSHVSTKVKGTFGYLDPNYFTTGKLTRKSDTYAFGVVLLEVLCGRAAVDSTRVAENERILTKWARENISNGNANQIIASNLRSEIAETIA